MTSSKLIATACALSLGGCVSVRDFAPDAVGVSATHVSTPFRGYGTAPIGNHDHSRETTFEALEGSLIWKRDGWRAESTLGLVLRSSSLEAQDSVLFTLRIGKEFDL